MRRAWLRYGLCLLAAMMVAVTSCGMTAEHHCRHCAEQEAEAHCHDHGICEHCDHCNDCWFFHVDGMALDVCPQKMCLPPVAWHEGVGAVLFQWTAVHIQLSTADLQTLTIDSFYTPPVPLRVGRRTLTVIHKLTV